MCDSASGVEDCQERRKVCYWSVSADDKRHTANENHGTMAQSSIKGSVVGKGLEAKRKKYLHRHWFVSAQKKSASKGKGDRWKEKRKRHSRCRCTVLYRKSATAARQRRMCQEGKVTAVAGGCSTRGVFPLMNPVAAAAGGVLSGGFIS